MKEEDLPQDSSALNNITREVCYVKGKDGKYTTSLSTGWEVKKVALDNAWDDIEERKKRAKEAVANGEMSPVFYFMEAQLMDFTVLSGYTGFWKFTIKRHFKPRIFQRLNDRKLAKYAKAFNITLDQLKNFKG